MAFVRGIRRWDLYWADLDPVVGSEQAGRRRPVVVVSNDSFNAAFSWVTVVPATKAEDKRRKPYLFEVVLERGAITEAHASIVMPQQVRTISKSRLLARIGNLHDPASREAIEERLLHHFGIEVDEELP